MTGIPFDPANPTIASARQIVLARLRAEPDWNQLDNAGTGFKPYVAYANAYQGGPAILALFAREVFWHLVVEGILTPGVNSSNLDLPWFRVTGYGLGVLSDLPHSPHDHDGYLAALHRRVPNLDGTVKAYLGESLDTFRRGSIVASAIMLGVAAERVFDLVCDALLPALSDPIEKAKFGDLLSRFQMKPKVDWVATKLQALHRRRLPAFPDNAPMMVTVIYDLLRMQRNDLGHPQESPPRLDRESAYANLQIFPTYCSTAEELRSFLAVTPV